MEKLHPSQRAINSSPSPIRGLIDLANKQKATGVTVRHFNIGQPDLPTHPDFFEAIRNFDEKIVAYAPTQGRIEAQEAWQTFFSGVGIDFELEDLFVTQGGVEALFYAQAALMDPGDELLVFEPFYPYYEEQAKILGITIVPITLDIKNGFHLPPLEEMQSKVTEKTKAMIVCNPSNPTGVVFTPDEVHAIAQFAVDNNLFIIADEVYREFAFDGEALSMAKVEEVREHVVLIDTTSKRFNLCGARVGVLASHNKELMKHIYKLLQSRESIATIEQVAVATLLNNADKYVQPSIAIYKERRDVIFEELQKIPGIEVHKPEGAFYVIMGFPIKDSQHFAEWLLTDFRHNNTTICVSPAAGFYKTEGKGKDQIRLSYVVEVPVIKESMEILRLGLEEYMRVFPEQCS